jgi:hypothetical protein
MNGSGAFTSTKSPRRSFVPTKSRFHPMFAQKRPKFDGFSSNSPFTSYYPLIRRETAWFMRPSPEMGQKGWL